MELKKTYLQEYQNNRFCDDYEVSNITIKGFSLSEEADKLRKDVESI